jgi:hypothetical protein
MHLAMSVKSEGQTFNPFRFRRLGKQPLNTLAVISARQYCVDTRYAFVLPFNSQFGKFRYDLNLLRRSFCVSLTADLPWNWKTSIMAGSHAAKPAGETVTLPVILRSWRLRFHFFPLPALETSYTRTCLFNI